MRKVIACLQGGLGNQCFIYAAAKALSLDSGADLSFSVDRFLDDKIYRRKLDLEQFCCDLKLEREHGYLHRKLFNQLVKPRCSFVERFIGLRREIRPARYQQLSLCGTRTILDGYWQSEKYFYHHRDVLAKDLMLKDPSWILNDEVAIRIKSEPNSIFLHMRSYTDIPGKLDYSGALPIAYYLRAVEFLKAKLQHGVFFVFSDDLIWAQSRISQLRDVSGGEFQFVSVESESLPGCPANIRDFWLMSMCRHGIVANSSFSWWAGWLGEQRLINAGEICIRIHAKRRCLNDDLWPERWCAIKFE